jgi:hypothetical protein
MKAVVIGSAVLLASCASSGEIGEARAALCAAQRFISENGYLERRTNGPVALELWDGLQFSTDNGEYDWDALGASRHRTLLHKLRGMTRSDGDFLVMYDSEGAGYRCLRVSHDLSTFHMHEAPCRDPRSLIRFNDRSLDCQS